MTLLVHVPCVLNKITGSDVIDGVTELSEEDNVTTIRQYSSELKVVQEDKLVVPFGLVNVILLSTAKNPGVVEPCITTDAPVVQAVPWALTDG
jgi:hypothetical protein